MCLTKSPPKPAQESISCSHELGPTPARISVPVIPKLHTPYRVPSSQRQDLGLMFQLQERLAGSSYFNLDPAELINTAQF